MTAPFDLAGLEQRARAVIDPAAYDYIAGGADDELTLVDNVAAWNRHRLRPRMLRGAAFPALATTVLGEPVRAPILVAPTAYHLLAHPDGERATARGVARAGTVMVLSTTASMTMEDVAAAAPDGPRWFQLYVQNDRSLTQTLLDRAEAADYRALVLTVDTPRLGRRARHGPGGYVLPDGVRPVNLYTEGTASLADYVATGFDPTLTFEAVEWLCAHSPLPVVVKGVLRGDDAVSCVQAGAAGVIVSNHGGRQLDGAVATADALPEVVAAVGSSAEVYVDGGVRRGTDVLRALALGARAVFVGRTAVFGLALGGADGVAGVLDALAAQTEDAFALAGVHSCADVGPDLLA